MMEPVRPQKRRSHDARWADKCALLRAVHADVEGGKAVCLKYGAELSRWVRWQRRRARAGTLGQQRIDRLTAIWGFDLDRRQKKNFVQKAVGVLGDGGPAGCLKPSHRRWCTEAKKAAVFGRWKDQDRLATLLHLGVVRATELRPPGSDAEGEDQQQCSPQQVADEEDRTKRELHAKQIRAVRRAFSTAEAVPDGCCGWYCLRELMPAQHDDSCVYLRRSRRITRKVAVRQAATAEVRGFMRQVADCMAKRGVRASAFETASQVAARVDVLRREAANRAPSIASEAWVTAAEIRTVVEETNKSVYVFDATSHQLGPWFWFRPLSSKAKQRYTKQEAKASRQLAA
jgi:hypothetical protein